MNYLELFKVYESMIDDTKDIKLSLRLHYLNDWQNSTYLW